MYFWRIEELKAKLVSAPLSDREGLPYLIVTMAPVSLTAIIPAVSMNVWDYLGIGWTFLLTVVGTIYLYRRNGGNAGVHFLQRYFAIGWVTTVRWFLPMLSLYVVLVFMLGLADETTWHGFLYFAIAELLLCWRIGHHIHAVATTRVFV